jgi:hypothetical protein
MHRLYGKSALCAVALIGIWASGARAAGWVDTLFAEKAHDFGPVPRGGKVRHDFVLTNQLQEPLTIVNVRASCGCTKGRTSATSVAPGQSAVIEAEMETTNFVGLKATTLFVSVVTASGREAEARLGVSSTILSDIVLNPGTIDFGAVSRGQSPTQVLTIDRVGLPSWRVEQMVSSSRVIRASLAETVRNGSSVTYVLKVTLKPDAPAGVVRDEIRLITNDPETGSIPIQVNAQIRGELSAKPGLLNLGRVSSAGGVQGRVLLTASKPFSIVSVSGDGDGFHAAPVENSQKTVHMVAISFRPEETTTRGDLRRSFRIQSDLPGEPPVNIAVSLHIDP